MLLPTWSIVFHKSSALRAMPMPPGWLSAKKIERVATSALVKMSLPSMGIENRVPTRTRC